jgi:hypothetical protein
MGFISEMLKRERELAKTKPKMKTADDVPHARVEVRNDGKVPKAIYHARRKHFIALKPGETKSVVVQFGEAQIMRVAQLMTRITVLKVEKLTDHLDE